MPATSPPPAPRRSVRNRVVSPPATRAKVPKPGSRLTTPFRAPERNFQEGSIMSGMDIDEDNFSERMNLRTQSSVYAKSDQILVSFYASLPLEVRQVLRTADFFSEPYTGDIDTVTGFALVASKTTCFVWQHAQALKGTPTCYIFSCPTDDSNDAPPLHALVPYGVSREPGLILMSTHGKVRFWDSIGIGLAGGDRFITTNLKLQPEEIVTNLIRSDSQTYVVATSAGGLYRLSLSSTGGTYHLSCHLFSKPTSHLSLSRLIPSIFSASASASSVTTGLSQNVNGVVLGPRTVSGGRKVWAIVDTRLQQWDMRPEGWEELVLEKDVAAELLAAIREHYNIRQDQYDFALDLEITDIALDGDTIVLLISHANVEESAAATENIRRTYALGLLSLANDKFKVEAIKNIPYQPLLSTGAPMHPRIKVLQDGILFGVQFGDAVALCAKKVSYRTCLELRTTADRTLGVGASTNEPTLLILTAATMMKVTVNTEAVCAYDSSHGEATLVKSILKQAILYSGLADNPLHFSFPPDVDVLSLMAGAEQISHAVMQSGEKLTVVVFIPSGFTVSSTDVEVIQKNHDLSAQMSERKERLSWLIRFINDNAVLPKISQDCRQKLEADAEKLYACRQLWLKHNELLAHAPQYSILNDAVLTYMEEAGEEDHEDVLRAFFRLRVGEIEAVIKKVAEITFQATKVTGRDILEFLPEANRIVLTILEAALDYRDFNRGFYGITYPMLNPWTSKPAIIDVVLSLFDTTSAALDNHKLSMEDLVHTQLPALANILFICIQERLDWLASLDLEKDLNAKQNHAELRKKSDLLRPEVFETLRKNGYGEIAFSLAERYQDFAGLATLCNRDTVYPPENNPNLARIQIYMEKFREDFTTELYRWYIQHGELRVMFANDESHDKYLDQFFRENPTPSISWINDLGKARYGNAANSLLADSTGAHHLEAKQLMLSIGKLASLVQLHGTNVTQAETLLDAFHDELDFISVQETLLQDFKSALKPTRSRQSLESQAEAIVQAKASKAQQQKAISRILKGTVRDLLQGKALSIEDAVDVLTLKDNEESLGDYATALHLLTQERNLPDARKNSAFRTVWRRVFLHDDWNTIRKTTNISDGELTNRFRNTALFATLCTALSTNNIPTIFDTLPEVVQAVPSPGEIDTRWPGLSEEETEAVIEDYNLERNRLAELDLSDVYHRIKELAAHEVVWKQNSI